MNHKQATIKNKVDKMKIGKRIQYPTMNAWNMEYAPAYNLKIYNVIRKDLRDKAYEIYSDEYLSYEIYDEINALIDDFARDTNYAYTAGFNGRQGGYLVLYKSCKITNYDKDGKAHTKIQTYMHGLDEKDIPGNVLKLFRNLAQGIVNHVESFLSEYDIVEQEIMIPKKIKTLQSKGA